MFTALAVQHVRAKTGQQLHSVHPTKWKNWKIFKKPWRWLFQSRQVVCGSPLKKWNQSSVVAVAVVVALAVDVRVAVVAVVLVAVVAPVAAVSPVVVAVSVVALAEAAAQLLPDKK
jgi:hypothetical protein